MLITKKTQIIRLSSLIFIITVLLLFVGCKKFADYSYCTGGIEGHTRHLTDAEKSACINKFPFL